MATATYGSLSVEQRTFYELELLERAVANFPHVFWGQQGIHPPTMIPENQGDVIDWRLLAAFSAVTTPLTEGVTPASESISITNVTATVAEYGSLIN